MKIHFCDLCNESVPQSDIDEGRAIMRKGRVICMTCDRAMSHASANAEAPLIAEEAPLIADEAAVSIDEMPVSVVLTDESEIEPAPVFAPVPAAASAPAAVPVAARQSSAGLWVAIIAMLFTAVAIALLNRSHEELVRRNERQELALTESNRRISSLVNRLETADQKRDAELARAQADTGALRQVFDAEKQVAREASAARERELATLSQAIAELRAELVAWREDVDRRVASQDEHLGRADDELRLLNERFSALEAGPVVSAEAAGGPQGPGSTGTPAWSGLLVDLTSPNAGIRWQAVVGLGDTKDPEVVPSLLPLLADKDVFVRMACARVLGDLGQNSAVPALIDALEDPEAPVREAASIALRSVTGKDLRFDPLGNEADRAKKVKAWREWWKKLQEEPQSAPG